LGPPHKRTEKRPKDKRDRVELFTMYSIKREHKKRIESVGTNFYLQAKPTEVASQTDRPWLHKKCPLLYIPLFMALSYQGDPISFLVINLKYCNE